VKELLIVIILVAVGTECVRLYNVWEEPRASREVRLAGLKFCED
jgi:hypothetical protein